MFEGEGFPGGPTPEPLTQERRKDGHIQKLKAIGAETSNWCSDLYVKSTPEVDKIVEAYEFRRNCGKFVSQIAGDGIWWDIPFAYIPYWEERMPITPTKEGEIGKS